MTPVQVTAVRQHIVQPPGGSRVADVGPGAQPVHVTALDHQPGQPPGGGLVVGVAKGA